MAIKRQHRAFVIRLRGSYFLEFPTDTAKGEYRKTRDLGKAWQYRDADIAVRVAGNVGGKVLPVVETTTVEIDE